MSNDYYENLPKRRMGVGALIMNEENEILIVKPSYKDNWLIPGGVIEKDESPREACLREAKEEVGIDLKMVNFLCVDYKVDISGKGECLQFIFFGGILNQSQISNIQLDKKEIIDYKFVKFNEALLLLSEGLRMRLPKCLDALKENTSVYLENGEII